MAQGWKTLVAATLLMFVLWTGAAAAQQPVTPLGPQHRLTQVGDDADATADADTGDVVFNTVRNEWLAVWEQSVTNPAADQEIFAQRLAADGTPIGGAFQVSGVASDPAGFRSSEPAVAYDPERDRYAVVFTRDDLAVGDTEIFLQLVRGDGQLVNFGGSVGGSPAIVSDIASGPAQVATSPDVVYRADADGNAATPDAFVVVYDGDDITDNENDIYATARRGDTGALVPGFDRAVSAMGATGDAFDPSITVVPGGDDLAIAFEGSDGVQTRIFARRLAAELPSAGAQSPIADAATGFTGDASITANTTAGQLLVAYLGQEVASDSEIFVQRLDLGLGQIGTNDQQVSSAGPPGVVGPPFFTVINPAAAYNPKLNRYVVSWVGNDTDRTGLSNDEREVQATSLDANGAEGATQDFVVSRTGADNDDSATVLDAALAANPVSGRWLAVWTADDPRPPLADNEFELYGRQLGENFDLDADGSPVPADCNDGNAGIRPGAPDVADNGVDEDCSGADTVNLDRDGDGSPRPADCNDANAAIAPGKRDIPNNDVDEDCANGARRVLTSASIERFFKVFRTFTKVTKLRVTKVKPGMKVRLRCTPAKGKGCPKRLRGNGRTFTIKKAGSKTLTSFVKKAKLEPGASLEVRILEAGAIGRLDTFQMRKAKLPKRVQRCIPFGKKKAQKTC